MRESRSSDRTADSARCQVLSVRYNNDDRDVLDLPPADVEAFYTHLPAWLAALRDPAGLFRFRLQPGTVLTYNNRRVLHGRVRPA
jgi:alpha-ketoglutarate-dependent taurine dioxygenase